MQLDFRAVEADTGNIGGNNSHEFHVLAASGEDTIVYASEGPYAANLEKAVAAAPKQSTEPVELLEKVATPTQKTIAAVAELLSLPATHCVKTLIVKAQQDAAEPPNGLIAIILRGDHDLNEIKAANLPGVAQPLTFAEETEIVAAFGAHPGSLGPVHCPIPMLVDREAAVLASFVCGANEDGVHYQGVSWQRDCPIVEEQIVDARNVVEGDPAPDGQGELRVLRGIEVGHIFQLDRAYSEPMGAFVLDHEGRDAAPIMGCYGMGVTRLVAAVIEQNHDNSGIVWPEPLAPFSLHIVALNAQKSAAVQELAEQLYQSATASGISVLLDDRNERPGVKFADADLIGIPHRIVIGDRGLQNGVVEYKHRRIGDNEELSPESALSRVTGNLIEN
ncbi:MAG: proline--tRNA ligase, partial [Pseudomonadales bacterium]|nr:proline--tRNA ligase [Pseudomonadales bacterium]